MNYLESLEIHKHRKDILNQLDCCEDTSFMIHHVVNGELVQTSHSYYEYLEFDKDFLYTSLDSIPFSSIQLIEVI